MQASCTRFEMPCSPSLKQCWRPSGLVNNSICNFLRSSLLGTACRTDPLTSCTYKRSRIWATHKGLSVDGIQGALEERQEPQKLSEASDNICSDCAVSHASAMQCSKKPAAAAAFHAGRDTCPANLASAKAIAPQQQATLGVCIAAKGLLGGLCMDFTVNF